jgi:drug/metabolite transporter (DMT)-like permease
MNRAWILCLILLSLACTTGIPILNKELYRIVPFPLYATGLQMTLTFPLALCVALFANGCHAPVASIIPQRSIFPFLLAASIAHGFMILCHNIGLFVSDWDFAIIFRFTAIVAQGTAARLFLGERLSWPSALFIAMVLAGTFLLTAKFEFSTQRFPSGSQIRIQLLVIVFQSIAQVCMKKALNVLKSSGDSPSPLLFLPFRYAVCQLPIYATAFFFQRNSFSAFGRSLSQRAIQIGISGVFVGLFSQMLMISLANRLTLIASAITGLLRAVPSLIASHFLYRSTQWTPRKVLALCLVSAGTFLFSWSRRDKKAPPSSVDPSLQDEEKQLLAPVPRETVSDVLNRTC